ncbi:hypothetical protein D9M70_481070 [compost metagenome]
MPGFIDNTCNNFLQLFYTRSQELQPSNRRRVCSAAAAHRHPKAAKRKERKSVIEYLAHHGVEIAAGELSAIRIGDDLKPPH